MSMAESTKRQNNAGGKAPVATPNVGQLVGLETAMSGAIGGRSVTLLDAHLSSSLRIFIFSYFHAILVFCSNFYTLPCTALSPTAALLLKLTTPLPTRVRLQTTIPAHPTLEGTLYTICPLTHLVALSTAPPKSTYHIVPLPSITTFTVVSPAPSAPAPPPYLPTPALQARAATALQRAHEKANKVNRNVSKEAQEIFDAISRILPTRWEGKDIVVMDHVTVKGPGYRSEDCRAAKEATSALARVKKVVSGKSFLARRMMTGKAVSCELAAAAI